MMGVIAMQPNRLSLPNYQEQVWIQLFSHDIYDIVRRESYEDDRICINYDVVNAQDFVQIRKVTDLSQSSLEKELMISITAESKLDSADVRQIHFDSVPVARIPLYTTSGFFIDGVPYGVKSESVLAAGWYISRNDANSYTLSHRSKNGETLRVRYHNGRFSAQIVGFKGSSGGTVDLWTFLKGISGSETFSDILKRLNMLDIFIRDYNRAQSNYISKHLPKNSEYREPSVEWCAEEVVKSYDKYKSTGMDCTAFLQKMIFEDNRLKFDRERIVRFKKMCSFGVAIGKPLAKEVSVNGTLLRKGTVLSAEDLTKIADAGIDHIYIQHEGKSYKLFEVTIEEGPTMNEIISAIYYFALVICGIGEVSQKNDFGNKAARTVSEMIGIYIGKKLENLTQSILAKFNANTTTSLIKLFDKADLDLSKQGQLMDEIFPDPTYDMQDETNSVSAFQQSYRLTNPSKMLGKGARMVQSSHMNRVCSFTTPESKTVGLSLSMAWGAKVTDGYITYSVYKVVNGVRQQDTVELTELEERNKVIAPYDVDLDTPGDLDEMIPNCRLNGEQTTARRGDIYYQIMAPMQSISPVLLFVPSFNRDSGKRLTMAANAITQARQPIIRERPWCSTGMEAITQCGYQTARSILNICMDELGLATSIVPEDTTITLIGINDTFKDSQEHSVSYGTVLTFASSLKLLDRFTYVINRLQPATNNSIKHQRVRFVHGGVYHLDDIVVMDNDMDDRKYKLASDTLHFGKETVSSERLEDCALAIGNNVNVMFKSFEGMGYEDSVIVSESFAKMYGLATMDIIRVQEDAVTDKDDGAEARKEFFTNLIDSSDSNSAAASHIGADGLAEVGSEVKAGQVVIGKKVMRGEAVSNSPVRLAVGQDGKVINTFTYTKKDNAKQRVETANVVIGKVRFLEVGDKVSGLHGNKGTVGLIVPDEDMPYGSTGRIDMILNPLGVISRTNIGQTVEAVVGQVGAKSKEVQFMEPFAADTIDDILRAAKNMNVVESDIYDGRTGRKYDRKAFIGNMYFLRSSHTSTSKHNACGLTDVKRNNVSLQPVRGAGGGQRVGEMFANAIRGHGATKVLDAFFTTQSDDQAACHELVEAIESGNKSVKTAGEYKNPDLFLAYFRTLGVNVTVDTDGTNKFTPLTDEDIKTLSLREIRPDMLSNTNKYTAGTLFLRDTKFLMEYAGKVPMEKLKREVYTSIRLPEPVIMPLVAADQTFLNMFIIRHRGKYKFMSYKTFKDVLYSDMILYNKDFVDFPVLLRRREALEDGASLENSLSGAAALMRIFEHYDVRNTLAVIEKQLELLDVEGIKPYTKNSDLKLDAVDMDFEEVDIAEGESKDMLKSVMEESMTDFDEYSEESSKEPDTAEKESDSSNQEQRDVAKQQQEDGESISVKKRIDQLMSIRGDIISFLDKQSVKDYFVHSVLIPPIAYRPDFEGRIASPVDKQLISLISKLKSYHANPGGSMFNQIYRELYGMVVHVPTMKPGEKTIFEMIVSHDKKNSKVRDTLFAKRVVGTGRSVITVDSSLRIDETRIPISIATTIEMVRLLADRDTYFPLLNSHIKQALLEKGGRQVFKQLFYCLANNNILEFREVLHLKYKNYLELKQIFDSCREELRERLETYFKETPVILCREPSLHKFNGQAFWAKVTDGYSICLHPLACRPYNADFDGDQMGVYVPFVEDAIEETKEKMMQHGNLVNPKDGNLILEVNQDMILGLYWMTMLESNQLSIKNPNVKRIYSIPADSRKQTAREKVSADLEKGAIDGDAIITFTDEDGQKCVARAKDAPYAICSDRFNEVYGAFDVIGFGQMPRDGSVKKTYTDDIGEDYGTVFADFDGFVCKPLRGIWEDVKSGDLMPQDTIILSVGARRYCSTVGRILFNSLMPNGLGFTDIKAGKFNKLRYEDTINSGRIKSVLSWLQGTFALNAEKTIEDDHEMVGERKIIDNSNKAFANVLDRIKDTGFFMADLSCISMSLFDFQSLELTKENMMICGELVKSINSFDGNVSDVVPHIIDVFKPLSTILQRITRSTKEDTGGEYVAYNRDHILVALNANNRTPYDYLSMNTDAYRGRCTIAQAYVYDILGKKTGVPVTLQAVEEILASKETVRDVTKTATGLLKALIDISSKLGIRVKSVFGDDIKIVTANSGLAVFKRKLEQIAAKEKDGYLTDTLKRNLILRASDQYKSCVGDDIESALSISRNTNLFIMVDSGARGNRSQLMEVCGTIGIVTDGSGNPIPSPIEHNLLTGLNQQELFTESYHARSILVDTQMDIPHSGALNRQLTYLTEYLKIRPEESPDEIACGADSEEIPIDWVPNVGGVKSVCISAQDLANRVEFKSWGIFIKKYFAIHNRFVLTQKSIRFIEHYLGSDGRVLLPPGNKFCSVSDLHPGMDIYIGNDEDAFTQSFRNEFIRHCDVSQDTLKLIAEDLHTVIPAVVNGEIVASDVTYTMGKRSVQMIYYRSIDMDKLSEEVRRVAQESCIHKHEHNGSGAIIASVIGNQFIHSLEQHHLYVQSIHIYTMANCECDHGICRRCFGLKYDTNMLPEPGELVGFTGVQSVCSTLSQMILDSHKSAGSGSAANEEISKIQSTINEMSNQVQALESKVWDLLMFLDKELQGAASRDTLFNAVKRYMFWSPLRLMGTPEEITDLILKTCETWDADDVSMGDEQKGDTVGEIIDRAIDEFFEDFSYQETEEHKIDLLALVQELKSIRRKLADDGVIDAERYAKEISVILNDQLPKIQLNYEGLTDRIGVSLNADTAAEYVLDVYFSGDLGTETSGKMKQEETQQNIYVFEFRGAGDAVASKHSRIAKAISDKCSSKELCRFLRMSVWLDLIQLMESKNVLGRNLEQFPKALVECGEALEDKFDADMPIAAGCVYKTKDLDRLGVKYTAVKLSARDAIRYNGQIYANAFLDNTRHNIALHMVRGDNGVQSTVGDCITGGKQELKVINYDFGAANSAQIRKLNNVVGLEFTDTADDNVVDFSPITASVFDALEEPSSVFEGIELERHEFAEPAWEEFSDDRRSVFADIELDQTVKEVETGDTDREYFGMLDDSDAGDRSLSDTDTEEAEDMDVSKSSVFAGVNLDSNISDNQNHEYDQWDDEDRGSVFDKIK